MKKVLIVAPYQFGELSDCYYWAKYATLEGIKVTYIGYRYKNRVLRERKCEGVTVIGVPHVSNRLLLGFMFFWSIIWNMIRHNIKNVIICRFPHCEIVPRIFPKRNIILDVRTLSVNPDIEVRKREDAQLRNIKQNFKTCSVISTGVSERIGGTNEILPLGAESFSLKAKDFSELKLFYIGGFTGRNLHVFLEGLWLAKEKYGIEFQFDLVGGGTREVEAQLQEIVRSKNLRNVRFHGFLNHDDAKHFFDECNVGVCFVPVTDYYQHQPPTKLYEYLLSGMATISTNTFSNEEAMNVSNGIVIRDTVDDVCEGLYKLYQNRMIYNSQQIVADAQYCTWQNIVKKYFLKLIKL